MHILPNLFLTFVKIGTFTFGGGYAMLSLVEETCVEQRKWLTQGEMDRITVIAESTPGPVALNCATYVGYKQKGLPGAVAASAGVVLPSFIILFLISLFLDRFLEIKWVASAFMGIKVAGGILIIDAGIRMLRRLKLKKNPLSVVILIVSFLAMTAMDVFAVRVSTVVLILAAAAAGLIAFLISRRKKDAGGGGE